jgi:hypothetical protein
VNFGGLACNILQQFAGFRKPNVEAFLFRTFDYNALWKWKREQPGWNLRVVIASQFAERVR